MLICRGWNERTPPSDHDGASVKHRVPHGAQLKAPIVFSRQLVYLSTEVHFGLERFYLLHQSIDEFLGPANG